ncbi:MAG: DUF222 domain-containing protein, partial [Candidatus Sericytochromatia bacterium]
MPAARGEHALLCAFSYAPVEEMGGLPVHVLADRLRISRSEARRLEEARDLGPRRPDELARFADWYADVLHPDGDFTDEHRASRRGITIVRQAKDGMSKISGWLDPQLRAGLDAVLAKLAAPGRCNPADE